MTKKPRTLNREILGFFHNHGGVRPGERIFKRNGCRGDSRFFALIRSIGAQLVYPMCCFCVGGMLGGFLTKRLGLRAACLIGACLAGTGFSLLFALSAAALLPCCWRSAACKKDNIASLMRRKLTSAAFPYIFFVWKCCAFLEPNRRS